MGTVVLLQDVYFKPLSLSVSVMCEKDTKGPKDMNVRLYKNEKQIIHTYSNVIQMAFAHQWQ